MMNVIANYWGCIVGIIAIIVFIIAAIIKFIKEPRNEQISNVKEWLKYAVTEAEKELGSGTGQLKLRYVYDLAINQFSFLKFISFTQFSGWVDEALDWLDDQLSTNKNIQNIVEEKEV